jgi:hypothetical protein
MSKAERKEHNLSFPLAELDYRSVLISQLKIISSLGWTDRVTKEDGWMIGFRMKKEKKDRQDEDG